MSVSLREQKRRILMFLVTKALSTKPPMIPHPNIFEGIINQLDSLFPPQLTEEEVEKILIKYYNHTELCHSRSGGKCNCNAEYLIDDCKSALIGKCGSKVNMNEKELGEFIRKNCSQYLIEEAYAYRVAKIIYPYVSPVEEMDEREITRRLLEMDKDGFITIGLGDAEYIAHAFATPTSGGEREGIRWTRNIKNKGQ